MRKPPKFAPFPYSILFNSNRGYNKAEYSNLAVSAEISTLFQYIESYVPMELALETTFKPFIPEYIPAVGEIDAFVKVTVFNLAIVTIRYLCLLLQQARKKI